MFGLTRPFSEASPLWPLNGVMPASGAVVKKTTETDIAFEKSVSCRQRTIIAPPPKKLQACSVWLPPAE